MDADPRRAATPESGVSCNGLLTEAALADAWAGRDRWLSDGGDRGAGRLIAKSGRAGVVFYFAFFDAAGRRRFRRIGRHRPAGQALRDGIDLAAARAAVAGFAAGRQQGRLAAIGGTAAATTPAEDVPEPQSPAAPTLADALEQYVAGLAAAGRPSAADVRRLFRRHVLEAWPDGARTPLHAVGPDLLASMVQRLAETGRARSAAKLRNCLRAALGGRKNAPNLPRVGAVGAAVAMAPVIPGPRALRALHAALGRIDAGPAQAALTLWPLLGAPSLTALLRLRAEDVDLAGRFVRLNATRGQADQPDGAASPHVLPLTRKAAWLIARRMHAIGGRGPLFADASGQPVPYRIVGRMLATSTRTLATSGVCPAPFGAREMRTATGLVLEAMGVDAQTRAALQRNAPISGKDEGDEQSDRERMRDVLARLQRHVAG